MITDRIKIIKGPGETRSELGGITSKSICEYRGRKIMIKAPNNPLDSFSEYFCFRLGKRLGIKVNKVKLLENNPIININRISKVLSVHWLEDNFIDHSKVFDLYAKGKINKEIWEKYRLQCKVMSFFDFVVKNSDRHEGNYGMVNNELFIIDHGCARPWEKERNPNEIKESCQYYASEKEIYPYIEKFLSLRNRDFESILTFPFLKDEENIQNCKNIALERFNLIKRELRYQYNNMKK